jgi:dATP pyrophosphohydrolase
MKVAAKLIEAHIFRQNRNDIEFLLLKRSDQDIYPDIWQMVTGRIEDSEKAFQTAIREIKEETNLEPLKLWVAPNVNSFYSSEADEISMIPVFAALVDSNSQVIISEEHSEFRWVKKDEAKKMLAWIGQRTSVDVIHEYFFNGMSALKFVEIDIEKIKK